MVILFVNEKRSLLFILLISCDPSIDKAYHRCDRVYAHTVWEPLLGEKKCSGMETTSVLKFIHFLIEIYQN